MARKQPKRRQQTRARRPAGTTPAGAGPAGTSATAGAVRPAGATRTAQAARIGGEQALVRSVEMSLAPGAPGRRGGRVVLENADPAIPLDRVPYFQDDLKRLGIVGAAMVALLVVAAEFVVPLFLR